MTATGGTMMRHDDRDTRHVDGDGRHDDERLDDIKGQHNDGRLDDCCNYKLPTKLIHVY
jgi:hypothetical protein